MIDPVLSRHLRPHQVEGLFQYKAFSVVQLNVLTGVKFMYECVMGLNFDGQGCILADEMYGRDFLSPSCH